MSNGLIYHVLLLLIFATSALTFVLLVFIKAPYGRYVRKGWGPVVSARAAWIIMETPAILIIMILFLTSDRKTPATTALIVLWQLHYVYRTFVYPLLMRGGRKAFPALLVLFALLFNGANGYVNGWFLFHGDGNLAAEWLLDPRFIGGVVLFICGLYIHISSDHILRQLRKPGETGYKIPYGGLYSLLSAPNYFGEILQWCGWAIASWSLAGLSFAVFTVANLLPRGIAHHSWYKNTFEDYPKERKAVIPFLI